MIKIIAFDLVGVLVKEKDIPLTDTESKLERLFGPNISDEEYLNQAKEITSLEEDEINKITANIINKLYEVKKQLILKKLKEKYPSTKIIIATNHISKIRPFIEKELNCIDTIYISAEINKIKPNKDFYEHIVKELNVQPNEILFLDDNQNNIEGAIDCGLNTIKINKGIDIYQKINKYIKNQT